MSFFRQNLEYIGNPVIKLSIAFSRATPHMAYPDAGPVEALLNFHSQESFEYGFPNHVRFATILDRIIREGGTGLPPAFCEEGQPQSVSVKYFVKSPEAFLNIMQKAGVIAVDANMLNEARLLKNDL